MEGPYPLSGGCRSCFPAGLISLPHLVNHPTPEQVIAQNYYIIASSELNNRSGQVSHSGLPILQQGRLEFYIEENYRTAQELFEQITREEPSYLEAQYYLAHCNFKLTNYGQAIKEFEMLLSTADLPGHIRIEELRWNLLLCNLAAGRRDVFSEMLQGLASSEERAKEPYRSLIGELLTLTMGN